jgi:5-methylthioadenosine/S-adenosylhomocysteine deaminase
MSDPAGSTGEDPRRCDLLLTGGAVVTVDDERRILRPGAVAITGDRIAAVGPASELATLEAARTVDCSGTIVLPGFTDCHTHLFQTLARGLGDGYALHQWLTEFMWRYATTITSEEARTAALLGAVQALRAGTTTIVDNHYGASGVEPTLGVASAIEEVGLRGAVARGIAGLPTEVARRMNFTSPLFVRSPEEELEITRALLEARSGARVGIWPAPLNVLYLDRKLFAASVELAREFSVRWHTHCSEGRRDPELFFDAYGVRPVEWLHADGLLGGDATLAHCLWLDDREIELLGETGSGVSHNPVSNSYIGSGMIRLRALRSAGAVVGLGTDGVAVTGKDMFEVMKQAVLVQRGSSGDPTASDAEEALELATCEGARYAGVDAGVLAPGKLADVVVVDADRPHLRPLHHPVSTLVYHANGSDVVMTIVGGRVVYENGRATLVDEGEIQGEADARGAELAKRAGLLASP